MVRRYLPVSTPRPRGDQASTPTPSTVDAGRTSRSIPRCSSEYSASTAVRPISRSRSVAARATCQPAWLDRPARVGRLDQPEVDVVGAQAFQGPVEGGQQPPARGVDHAPVARLADARL